jgi:hypothetical protein
MSANLHFCDDGLKYKPAGETFNVGNDNASHILSAMGFDPNFNISPPIDINEFIKGAELFLSSGLAEFIDQRKPMVRDGNWIDGGRREGYLKEKIPLILEMARIAKNMGATHAYFM